MKLAPLAVFGAMVHLVGEYGLGVMKTYAKLVILCYAVALAFLALSATASSLGAIPAGAVALLLGVDRIMDSMGVVTNLLGNCVAVFAVSKWEGALDADRAKKMLDGEIRFVEEEDGPGEGGAKAAEVLAQAEVPASVKAEVSAQSKSETKEPASEAG